MKKAVITIIAMVLVISCSACGSAGGAESSASASGSSMPQSGAGGGNRGGGSVDKSGDTQLQDMIANVAPKFILNTFEDTETKASLKYWLFTPENYDSSKRYPLLQFIPDSSVVGKDDSSFLTQGWGGLIWAAKEEQDKHPCIVVVPVFTETVVDDSFNHSAQIDTAMNLLKHLTKEYSIDESRIYTTGQSMGGMTSFYLNIAYPDFFAASMFVGSQWDNSKLNVLEKKKFFYIVSAGDPKASAGQSELLEVFKKDKAAYSHAQWSAKDEASAQDKAVKELLSQGNSANFVTFTAGTTLADGQSAMPGAGEHMTSFDYAYKITAVRDWLFEQTE
ncbi:MAG: hypothetical protein IK152_08925 [Lachnospiraceae bacterium]|nr:hypothetical protein [Lachnospiraceae bacterium]